MSTQQQPFGRVRSLLWPIHMHELKKLISMFFLFFFITFLYNLLRPLKISLVVTASGSGAEIVPFLKIGSVLPCALFLTFIFTKLNNYLCREKVFYAMVMIFLSYFFIFLFVLYPNHQAVQLDGLTHILEQTICSGEGFKGLLAVIRHWDLAIFYGLAETWGAIVLSMLAWGFANEVTKVNEAKRFYAIFAIGANSSGIFSGLFAEWIARLPYMPWLPFDEQNQWIWLQMIFVLLVGGFIMTLFSWLNCKLFADDQNKSAHYKIKKKEKMSLMECFSYLKKSRYLTYIVILVIAYNVVYNLADVMWTHQVKQVYQTGKLVNAYINRITVATGIIAVIFAFIMSGNVIRFYGWTAAALITPILWLLSSLGFFSGLLFHDTMAFQMILSGFFSNPANLVLLIGSLQICFGRACKYTIFDETKEIAFIPLSRHNQRKAKAVVDGLASRLGKSGGAFIYLILFIQFGAIDNVVPFVAALIIFAIFFWLIAVKNLGSMVNNSIDQEMADLRSDLDLDDLVTNR